MTSSSMSSRSDQSDESRHSRQGRHDIKKKGAMHEDKSPHLQGQGCQRCSNLPKLEVGFNSVLANVQGAGIAPSYHLQ